MDIQNESDIDIRAGHVIGSEHTRTYTRKSDEDSNRSLRKKLGIEEGETKDWKKVLWPKKCSKCNELNSGHRDLCNSCSTALTDKAYNYKVKNQEEEHEMIEMRAKFRQMKNLAEKMGLDTEDLE